MLRMSSRRLAAGALRLERLRGPGGCAGAYVEVPESGAGRLRRAREPVHRLVSMYMDVQDLRLVSGLTPSIVYMLSI